MFPFDRLEPERRHDSLDISKGNQPLIVGPMFQFEIHCMQARMGCAPGRHDCLTVSNKLLAVITIAYESLTCHDGRR